MRIGEFSDKTNTSVDTLRYYDKIGLLVPKRKSNIRQYDADNLKTIEIINVLKEMKYSLDDIKEIIELDRKIDESIMLNTHYYDDIANFKNILDEKYKEILKQEETLSKAKKKIEHIQNKLNNYMIGGEEV